MDFGEAHERYLASYRTGFADVWCSNPVCTNHRHAVSVRYESEYGQGWYVPEECDCGGEWLDEEPPEVDAEDDG